MGAAARALAVLQGRRVLWARLKALPRRTGGGCGAAEHPADAGVGLAGVGKSCLLLRFAEDSFTSSFITTIGCGAAAQTAPRLPPALPASSARSPVAADPQHSTLPWSVGCLVVCWERRGSALTCTVA